MMTEKAPPGYRVTVKLCRGVCGRSLAGVVWKDGRYIAHTAAFHEFRDSARKHGIKLAWEYYNAENKKSGASMTPDSSTTSN